MNNFKSIPREVAEITALQTLILANNRDLRLAVDDLYTLSALSQLSSLHLFRNCSIGNDNVWSGRDVAVALALKERFPDLACRFEFCY